MEGKSRIAVSEIVKVLMEGGAVKSKTTAYDWVEKETVGFGRVVEDGQKFWEGDFSKLFTWLKNKLGEKEVVREIVEQGVPFSKYEQLIEEIRKLEKEVAGREAEILIAKREKEELLKKYEELQKELEKVKGSLKACEEEVELRERKIRELSRKLKLKELEPVIGELPEDKRKALLKLFEEM